LKFFLDFLEHSEVKCLFNILYCSGGNSPQPHDDLASAPSLIHKAKHSKKLPAAEMPSFNVNRRHERKPIDPEAAAPSYMEKIRYTIKDYFDTLSQVNKDKNKINLL
jgi:hypothetical protein